MASKPARGERERSPGGSFATSERTEPKSEPGQSQAKELRDLAFIALDLFDVPVEQKLAAIEYKLTLRRLTFRHRLSEAIDLVYPWLLIGTYAVLALLVSARQQRQRRPSAGLEAHERTAH